MRDQLQAVRDWANQKIATGEEPPWAWFQYMKLRETLDQILSGQDAVTTESSPQSGAHSEKHLRLVEAKCQPDSVLPHPAGLPVQMPM